MKLTFQTSKIPAWRNLLSAPFIYAVFIPVVFADICVEIYHRICFPLYGIPYVKRGNYILIDRHRLKIKSVQKLNCVYCGYVNGWLNYAQEIAARTERYWCNIKHEDSPEFVQQDHHKNFIERKNFE